MLQNNESIVKPKKEVSRMENLYLIKMILSVYDFNDRNDYKKNYFFFNKSLISTNKSLSEGPAAGTSTGFFILL